MLSIIKLFKKDYVTIIHHEDQAKSVLQDIKKVYQSVGPNFQKMLKANAKWYQIPLVDTTLPLNSDNLASYLNDISTRLSFLYNYSRTKI